MIVSSLTPDPSLQPNLRSTDVMKEMTLDRHFISGSDLKLGSSGVSASHIMNDMARSSSTVHNSSVTNSCKISSTNHSTVNRVSSITSTSDYDLNQATREEDIQDDQLIHTSQQEEEVLY